MIDYQPVPTAGGMLHAVVFLTFTSERQMTATQEVIAGVVVILIGLGLFLFRERFIKLQLLSVQGLKPMTSHLATIRRLLEVAWVVFSIVLILIGLSWLLPFV